jgi:proteic killer suppression protein
MIRSFGSKETEKIWDGIRSNKIPPEVQKVGLRKLRMINNSIDINDQWRIIFRWEAGHAQEVEIADYRK